ncbi:hypothetical protein P3T76_009116 [Phytophthora citrophthora]|uniref:Chromo domain-containing protein n=1 Tax=Phytophthora citrophthora TaxID=4793 RepID=A0AAD9GIC3_9STRA|nr:hypothetical protein P3T76_009116 [Phytophthora citrophthora]
MEISLINFWGQGTEDLEMASTPVPVAHSQAGNDKEPPDREKEFFTIWLRLMERQKDATKLTQDMQSLLAETGDVVLKLQSARHQANLQSANDKSISEIVALLNDYFFRDIVPALKRAKESTRQPQHEAQDPLDQYLENGEDGTAISQDFVDDMSGWGAEEQEKENNNEQQQKSSTEAQETCNSDDEISSEMFHDLLFHNSIKYTEEHARAVLQHTQQAAQAQRRVPPPIVTNLRPRPASTGSTPETLSRSPSEAQRKKDRIGKRAAADLTALQVLGARTYGSSREYFIRWQEFERPLWISRRKASSQAKELIDLYLSAEVRARGGASPNQTAIRTSPKARRRASRDGQARQKSAQQFYTVDHIVDHRLFYNKRQYLVRWENYDKSEDTWQDGELLRADVPEIVEAYEQQRQREATRDDVIQSAMSELIRDGTAGSKTEAKKKRTIPSVEAEEDKDKMPSGNIMNELAPNHKKQRAEDSGNDDQFDVEEAELEEFSDDEFADKLNN